MYLGWYDPTPDKKKSVAAKLSDACQRYHEKWGRWPTVALLNAQQVPDAWGIGTVPCELELRAAPNVSLNVFYVGEE